MDVEFDELSKRVIGQEFWLTYLARASSPASLLGMHLAIFSEPYLSLLLNGQKTVESRFSRTRCAPFRQISAGDIILLKEVSGPIRGLTLAGKTRFVDLSIESLLRIKQEYGYSICADDDFWEKQRDACYGTLIELSETIAIEPLPFAKRDRRGWVPLRSPQMIFAF